MRGYANGAAKVALPRTEAQSKRRLEAHFANFAFRALLCAASAVQWPPAADESFIMFRIGTMSIANTTAAPIIAAAV